MSDPNTPVTGYPAPNLNPNPHSSATAYPYAAAPPPPPPPPPPHPYYPNPTPASLRRATFLRRALAATIALLITLAAVTFIAWLILRPQIPQFRINSFTLSNLTFTNTTTSLISFTAQLRLTARNPNRKITLSYNHIDAAVYYKSWRLSETTLPPFTQNTNSETPLTANFVSLGNFVERVAGDEIREERGRRGSVGFNLRMMFRVRFKAEAWRPRSRYLKVFCGDLIVGLTSDGRSGSLSGGSRRCRVGI